MPPESWREARKQTCHRVCLGWVWSQRPGPQRARAELCLPWEGHVFPTARTMKKLSKKLSPLLWEITACCAKLSQSLHRRTQPKMVICPVVLAWRCFPRLTVLSSRKFLENLSHDYPFGFSFLIIKPTLCAENCKMAGRYKKIYQ